MEIKRYIDCYINTESCNFRCPYCYITQRGTYSNKVFKLVHSPSTVKKALSNERLGGIALINLCAGGETLLSPDIIPIAKVLVEEGHYVMIVTNGSLTKRFKEICNTFNPEERGHLFFKFSFHYSELKRLNLMQQYFDNIRMIREMGCSFTCELTPCDEFIPYIEDIKNICMKELGAYCHVTIARDDTTKKIRHLSALPWDDYKKIWGSFESSLFDFKKKIYYERRKEFCYAGDWTLFVDLATGNYRPCNCGAVLGNIYNDEKINFRAIGDCKLSHCFNGHSWLVLGAIPNFTNVTYADERNRTGNNGIHWLTETFEEVFSSKLEKTNKEYSETEKILNRITSKIQRVKEYLNKR